MTRVVLVLVAAGLSGSVAAQQRPAAQPVFRAGITYVSLDVVVTDSKDRPVTDLRREEFVVVEKGRPQRIEDFAFVSIPPAHTSIDFDADPPPAADVATNAVSVNASRALAIVVDDTQLPPDRIMDTRRALRGLIEGLAPGDQVGFTYMSRSDLGRDFTSDHSQLIRSVNGLRGALGVMPQGRVSSGGGGFGAGPVGLTGLSEPSIFIVLRNVIETLSVARQSRKAIVLVGTSGCNPVDQNFGGICKDIIKRATRAGVPIYGLNPLGLQDAMSSVGAGGYDSAVGSESVDNRPPGSLAAAPQGRVEIEEDIANATNSLKILARETGGRAFVQASVQDAVQAVMADNGNFYLLGYYPDPRPGDGKFQDVDVSVTRPGLHVRARKGYAADGGKTRALPIVARMTKELGAGLPDPSLPLRAFVAPVMTGKDGMRAVVTAELTYPAPEGGFAGAFDDEWRMGILALDADGQTKASFQRPMAFKGRWKPGAKGTFVLNEVVDLPRSTVTVRVGVSSVRLGVTGTVHVPVTVPDFGKKELQLSPLVLGMGPQEGPSVDAAVGLDRLRGLVPFLPSTQRTYKPGQQLRVFANAFWRSKDETLSAEVFIDGVPDLQGGLQVPLKVTTNKDGQRQAVLDCTLSLDGVQPGDYVLRIDARLSGGEFVTREVPFAVR